MLALEMSRTDLSTAVLDSNLQDLIRLNIAQTQILLSPPKAQPKVTYPACYPGSDHVIHAKLQQQLCGPRPSANCTYF